MCCQIEKDSEYEHSCGDINPNFVIFLIDFESCLTDHKLTKFHDFFFLFNDLLCDWEVMVSVQLAWRQQVSWCDT